MDSVDVLTEDPTETVFDFVEFPIVIDDIVELQSSNSDTPPVGSDNNGLSDSLGSV